MEKQIRDALLKLTKSIKTIQDDISDRAVSLSNFGAVGDGIVDDTAAIKAALATGLNVFAPNGLYRYTDHIEIATDGQMLYGSGMGKAVFISDDRMIDGTTPAMWSITLGKQSPSSQITSDVVVRDITVKRKTMAYHNGDGEGILARNCKNFTITQCEVTNVQGWGIHSLYGQGGVIDKCYVHDVGYDCIHSSESDGVRAVNNICANSNDDKIAFTNYTTINGTGDGCYCSGNYILSDAGTDGGGSGIKVDSYNSVMITGNYIYHTGTTDSAISVFAASIYNAETGCNVKIKDNIIISVNKYNAVSFGMGYNEIEFDGNTIEAPGTCIDGTSVGNVANKLNLIIHNNTLKCKAYSATRSMGVYVDNNMCNSVIIQNNPFIESYKDGIVVGSGNGEVIVKDNNIRYGKNSSTMNSMGIFIYMLGTDIKKSHIINNTITSLNFGAANHKPILLDNGLQHVVEGNKCMQGTVQYQNGATIYGYGKTTFDPPSIATGVIYTTTCTVPGAALGDAVVCGGIGDSRLQTWAVITASETATINIKNNDASAVDLGSQIVRCKLVPFSSIT